MQKTFSVFLLESLSKTEKLYQTNSSPQKKKKKSISNDGTNQKH